MNRAIGRPHFLECLKGNCFALSPLSINLSIYLPTYVSICPSIYRYLSSYLRPGITKRYYKMPNTAQNRVRRKCFLDPKLVEVSSGLKKYPVAPCMPRKAIIQSQTTPRSIILSQFWLLFIMLGRILMVWNPGKNACYYMTAERFPSVILCSHYLIMPSA